MPKRKITDKIKNLIKKLNLNISAEKLCIDLSDNSESGFVCAEKLSTIPCNNIDLIELIENSLITYNKNGNYLFINPYNDIHYSRLTTERKRRYIKTSSTPLLNSEKINGILFRNEENEEIKYTTKTNGFKVPRSFRPYFTSEPISEMDIETFMRTNPRSLEIELKRRNLTKEIKIVLAACMDYCKDGDIKTNRYNLCKSLRNKYKLRSFPQSTFNLCIQKLIEARLISEVIIDGSKCLRICDYKASFDRHEPYIIVPDCVFKKEFKRLQASCVKMFYDILFKLNNGEDGKDSYLGQNKEIYIKFKKIDTDDLKTKLKYDGVISWLKKRYPGEFRDILFGSNDKKDYIALAEYFHFTKPDKNMKKENVLQARIRKEYFISKKVELFKPLLNLKKKDKEKFEAIEKTLKESKINLTDREIVGIIRVLKKESINVIKHLLQELAARITKSQDEGWEKVDNVVRYISKMYKNLNPL
jgi:hypothetical protein